MKDGLMSLEEYRQFQLENSTNGICNTCDKSLDDCDCDECLRCDKIVYLERCDC